MERRETLEHLSVILGGAIALPIASGFLAGCQPSGDPGVWKPQALSSDQSEILTVMTERIIPKTDTPGATDARVVEFLDLIVADWFDDPEKKEFFEGMNEALALCEKKNRNEFLSCSSEQQTAFLSELDKEFHSKTGESSVQAKFMSTLKQFTIIGFYTSELGATQELREPIMGQYPGCIPMDETTRAWAW